jgi:tetratricopeptide (TPR) repeat protein
LKLGQWQRDRSNFAEARKNLEAAISLAEKCPTFTGKELAEFYTSYADFLSQIGEERLSESYFARARRIRADNERASAG